MIPYQRAYSTLEVAKLWGVSAKHVRNLIRRGKLVAFWAGHNIYRISEDALGEYLRRHGSTKSEASDVEAS
jgi:excisionase family DNA binding protein